MIVLDFDNIRFSVDKYKRSDKVTVPLVSVFKDKYEKLFSNQIDFLNKQYNFANVDFNNPLTAAYLIYIITLSNFNGIDINSKMGGKYATFKKNNIELFMKINKISLSYINGKSKEFERHIKKFK